VTVALLTVELFIPEAQSLKEKRMVLRRLKDRLGHQNVSVAEVAHQDVWQRSGLAIAAVATDDAAAERAVTSALREIERLAPDLVTKSQVEYLR
jgi:hypothetical protein